MECHVVDQAVGPCPSWLGPRPGPFMEETEACYRLFMKKLGLSVDVIRGPEAEGEEGAQKAMT